MEQRILNLPAHKDYVPLSAENLQRHLRVPPGRERNKLKLPQCWLHGSHNHTLVATKPRQGRNYFCRNLVATALLVVMAKQNSCPAAMATTSLNPEGTAT